MKFFKIIGKVTVGAFAFGFLVMVLWNALIPAIFDLPYISFFQAVGLIALSRLLFGSWGGSRWGRGGCRKGSHCHSGGQSGREHWRQKFAAKMEGLSDEEREAFKRAFKGRCGMWSKSWGQHPNQNAQDQQQQHDDSLHDEPEDKF